MTTSAAATKRSAAAHPSGTRRAALCALWLASGCARAGISEWLDGGSDAETQDSGAEREACEEGVSIRCNCDDGWVSGRRTCEPDSDSPSFGYLSACSACSPPDGMDSAVPIPDGGAPMSDADMGDGAPRDAARSDTGAADTGSPEAGGATCSDGEQNGGESDVDCGGACGGCAAGKKCGGPADCAGSASCTGGVCTAVTAPNFHNYEHGAYSYARAVNWDCAGTTRFDSSGSGSWTQTSGCSDTDAKRPEVSCGVAQTAAGGPAVCILRARGFTIAAGHTLELVGDKPVILAVEGDATIAGTISADASGSTPGAGGNWSCGTSQGGNGAGNTARFDGASGGGGGGFGTHGGQGGTADTDGSRTGGGTPGQARGNANLSPLLGGCAGGRAGGCDAAGGAGGGALQIAASGALVVRGTVRAEGGAGATPCGANDEGGGSGAGSGGGVLLEGKTLDVSAATLRARGGAGGRNGSFAGIFNCGQSAGGVGASAAAANGGDGEDCQGGGSGAGGGHGRVVSATVQ